MDMLQFNAVPPERLGWVCARCSRLFVMNADGKTVARFDAPLPAMSGPVGGKNVQQGHAA